jgi:hypothetical protein
MAKVIFITKEELEQIEIFEYEGGEQNTEIIYIVIERYEPEDNAQSKIQNA